MPFEFKKDQGVIIAVLAGAFDKARGEEFAAQVEREVPKGSPLMVDGSALQTLTQEGVLQLIAVQRWASTPERKRLSLVGFNPTVWRAIVENGSDFFFDSKATLAEAMRSFSPVAPDVRPTAAVPPAPPSAALAYDDAAETMIAVTLIPERPRQPPRAPVKVVPALEPATNFVPASAQAPLPRMEPAAAPASPAPVFTPSPFAPPVPSPPRSKELIWAGLAAALLLALGAGGWWLFGSHPPTLTLSAPSTVVEEDGKEPDELTVQVSNGRLEERSWSNGLPNGLYFDAASDFGARAYTLRGKAAAGSAPVATMSLVAVSEDGKRRSAPVPFTVTVTPKPMAWQLTTLQSLRLKAGQRIWATSKFLVNASGVVGSGVPPGVAVERVPNKAKDWQLAGAPTTAGSYPVTFTATAPDGKTEAQSCTLVVEAGEAEAPKPVVVSAGTPATVAATPVPVAPASPDLDDGMRRFLLERIENLPSTYTDQEREKLRELVSTLRQARLVHRVVFEREGQVALSSAQAGSLRDALNTPDVAALLKNPACQIVVVGYASRSGSLAANVRLSKQRARNVNDALRGVVGRNADLCGDYGPTDVVDQGADEKNRAVEVYAGILEPSADMQSRAAMFKQKFNREHGLR